MTTSRPTTAFEQQVYDALHRIPRGRVTTYALLGRHLSCDSPRAIGQALKRNPFAPEVPCHRVVRSDMTLGGYGGAEDGDPLERKRRLLADEGVRFRENGSVDPACCHSFED